GVNAALRAEPRKTFSENIAHQSELVGEQVFAHLGDVPSWQIAMDAVHKGSIVTHLRRHWPEEMTDALLVLNVNIEISDHYNAAFGANALATTRELAGFHVPFHDIYTVLLIEGNS